MGCSNATLSPSSSRSPKIGKEIPDTRVPFTTDEIGEIQLFWEYTKTKFHDTAKESLIRFFHQYPFFQQLFPQLKHLHEIYEMRENLEFEIQAIAIFGLFDEVIPNLKVDVDRIFMKLEEIAQIHSRIDGFNPEFFQYMEEPFLDSLKEGFALRFNEQIQTLFTRLYKWIAETLQQFSANNNYRKIPDS